MGHCQVLFLAKSAIRSLQRAGSWVARNLPRPGPSRGGHQLVFFCGAALEDARQVLDAFLAGVDGFYCTDFVGDVADDGNAHFFGFGSGGEVAIARHQRLDLDEVGAIGFEFVDDAAAVGGVL